MNQRRLTRIPEWWLMPGRPAARLWGLVVLTTAEVAGSLAAAETKSELADAMS